MLERKPRKEPRSVDIAVVGGGPAGTSAALTVRKYSTLSVALIERSDYTQPRGSESVSSAIRSTLEFLGVWDDFAADGHIVAYGAAAAWGSGRTMSTDYVFTAQGDGWLVDRGRFDRMLARHVEARGGVLMKGARLATCEQRTDGTWRLEVEHPTGPMVVHARFVIDASGRGGTVARRLGARRQVYDTLIGVVAYGRAIPGEIASHTVLVEARPDGWWYSAPSPDGGLVAMFMGDADAVRRAHLHRRAGFAAALSSAELTRSRIDVTRLESEIRIRPAFSQRLEPAFGPGWVAAGEAAAAFDPLSSIGIGFALTSGSHAARAAHDVLTSDGSLVAPYAEGIERHFEAYWTIRARYYGFERRWPERPFWASRQGARVSAAG